MLAACDSVLDDFPRRVQGCIAGARLFIFETYCRIHQCIDIAALADKLGMDKDSAERGS